MLCVHACCVISDSLAIFIQMQVPAVPVFIAATGVYEVDFHISISCRDGCIYTIRRFVCVLSKLFTTVRAWKWRECCSFICGQINERESMIYFFCVKYTVKQEKRWSKSIK